MKKNALFLVLVLLPAPLSAGWKAGVASIDMTPAEPSWLGGYASRRAPSTEISSRIMAKAIALQDDNGRRLVAITCDLLTMPREVAEPVAARISRAFAIPRARILLCASHSHSAPIILDRLLGMYPLDGDRLRQVERYTREVGAHLFEAARRAIESLEPARVLTGSGKATFAINRRKRNPGDPIDHEVPVLCVEFTRAKTAGAPRRRAALFAYACHNTTLSGPHMCGDYAGFAQEDLEKDHPGLTALFAAGCAGDQNPDPRRSMKLARKHGRSLATAVSEVLSAPMQPLEADTGAAFGHTKLELVKAPDAAELEKQEKSSNRYVSARAKRLLETLRSGGSIPTSYDYTAQAWRLGGGQFVVALAGEVVVDYALRLKREVPLETSGGARVMALAYANDCPAYIPNERILREGGYEGDSSMIYYGFHGPWAAGIEKRVMDLAHRLVRTAALREGPGGTGLDRIWAEGIFTEGPTVGPDGALYFSDIPNNRILRHLDGNTSVYRRPSGRTNGLKFDRKGRLLMCQGADGGARQVSRIELDGSLTVLADRIDGKRFNSPNDLTIDSRGRIYFSDPRYKGAEPRELETESVYRIDAPGRVRLVAKDLVKPNGLAVSPDGKTLYISDAGASRLYACELSEAGECSERRLLFDFGEGRGVDGMEVHPGGNIYAAAGRGPLSGIWVLSPGGVLLDFIPTPELATNCCFDAATTNLYITASTSVYRARLRKR